MGLKRLNFKTAMLDTKLFIILIFIIISINGCATIPRQAAIMPKGVYHIVGSGQTLYSIAKAYHIDINEIIRVNKINDPAQIGVGQSLFIPKAKAPLPIEPSKPVTQEAIAKAVGPKHFFSKWYYITLHHSATLKGNAECFDRNHRSRRMGGLFYHFVIGNGTDSGDGEIEVGWRWRMQQQVNRPFDIQICLVGDFTRQEISEAQFESLVKLINVLRKQYNTPLNNIRKHKNIEGKHTECPGDNFPFHKLLAELRKPKF